MKRKIYLETSVISYLTARPSKNIIEAGHQQSRGCSCLLFAHLTNSWETTMTDSIIDEVRAIREQHAASLGFDLDRIFADLQARQNKHAAEGWTIIPAPASPPSEPNSALQRTRFAQR